VSILSGPAIEEAVGKRKIEIDPFVPANLNPASYDLTLGSKVLVYDLNPMRAAGFFSTRVIDVKEEQKTERFYIQEEGFVIRPGIGYLMHTRERVRTDCYVPVIDGKSSLGRLFVSIHQTAGYGDAGFDGQYTLEVSTLYQVRLHAGMRIAQIRFHELSHGVGAASTAIVKYAGNYVGKTARGPVASRSWKMFK
jgi:dCTP deaminase